MDPREIIAAIAPKTGDIGSSFYFHPDTVAKAKSLGLDGFRIYFLGRGGVLGDVESAVVSSAFGYFEPGLLAHMWNTAEGGHAAARRRPRVHGRQPRARTGEVGRRRRSRRATSTLPRRSSTPSTCGGYPLFAGVRAEPVPGRCPARAIHLAMVMREMRGSVHLAAIRAVGLTTLTAHAIKRPTDVELFGWKRVAGRHRRRPGPPHARRSHDERHAGARRSASSTKQVRPRSSAGTDAMHAALKG